MRASTTILLAALSALLAACAPTGTPEDSPFAGANTAPRTTAFEGEVDQMIVGDRLMEAGEYELALRAYIRDAAADGFEPVHLLALGSANLALGRLGQAETQFREATEALPDEPVAWNNLGVVLMERAEYGEASQVFRRAFALDSGQSDSIRENLRLALARLENRAYTRPIDSNRYGLERRGGGRYLLIDSTIP
ncbi:MAG: tetratricopeptide repeat protein [Pseudomonadota bacterium]